MNVIASWDDGSFADIKMADLMSKYNIPTTFYWPSLMGQAKNMAFTSSWLKESEQKGIANRFSIGSHSVSHQEMKKMSIEQVAMEITDSKKYWQDFTGQEIASFAYPKNSITSLTKALVKGAGYKSARTSIPGWLTPGEDFYAIQCTVQVGIDRIEYENICWEYFFQKMIDKCDENSVFHIFGSSFDVEASNDWIALENLIKKLKGIN